MGSVRFIYRARSYAIGGNGYAKNSNKLIEWEAFVDAVGIKGADLKNESLLYVFAALCVALM